MAGFPEILDVAINKLINTLTHKLLVGESDTDAIEEFIQLSGIPFLSDGNIQAYAKQKAEEIWGPYKDLPLPSAFDPAIQALEKAQSSLTNTGVTSLEAAEAFTMNAFVPEFMADFRTNQAGWCGATIDAVRSGYLEQWGGMVFLQANTLAMLRLALQGYQMQISKAQTDVVTLVNRAEEVVASYGSGSVCSSIDSKNVTFNIAIGVLGVVSAATGAAGLAVASIASAAAGGGLGAIKDSYEPAGPKESDIQGDSVASIWQSILDATEKLRGQFQASDKELYDIVASFHSGILNGRVRLGTTGAGGLETVPAMEVFSSKPLGAGTRSVERPVIGSDNPDPAHSPQR